MNGVQLGFRRYVHVLQSKTASSKVSGSHRAQRPYATIKSMASHLHGIDIQREELRRFCSQNRIRKLALFGSVLTDRFRPDSDVDVLVEFEANASPTYFDLTGMEQELSTLFGRRVDLRTPRELSRYFRDQVLASAVVQYERK